MKQIQSLIVQLETQIQNEEAEINILLAENNQLIHRINKLRFKPNQIALLERLKQTIAAELRFINLCIENSKETLEKCRLKPYLQSTIQLPTLCASPHCLKLHYQNSYVSHFENQVSFPAQNYLESNQNHQYQDREQNAQFDEKQANNQSILSFPELSHFNLNQTKNVTICNIDISAIAKNSSSSHLSNSALNQQQLQQKQLRELSSSRAIQKSLTKKIKLHRKYKPKTFQIDDNNFMPLRFHSGGHFITDFSYQNDPNLQNSVINRIISESIQLPNQKLISRQSNKNHNKKPFVDKCQTQKQNLQHQEEQNQLWLSRFELASQTQPKDKSNFEMRLAIQQNDFKNRNQKLENSTKLMTILNQHQYNKNAPITQIFCCECKNNFKPSAFYCHSCVAQEKYLKNSSIKNENY